MLCHRATLAMAHSPVGSAPACPQKGTQLTLLAPRAQAQQRPVKVVERPRAASVQPSRPRTTATQRDHRACGYARHGGRYCPPPLGRPGQQPAAGRSPTRWRVERLFYNTFRQGVRNFLINLLTEVASGPQFTTGEFGLLLSSRSGGRNPDFLPHGHLFKNLPHLILSSQNLWYSDQQQNTFSDALRQA